MALPPSAKALTPDKYARDDAQDAHALRMGNPAEIAMRSLMALLRIEDLLKGRASMGAVELATAEASPLVLAPETIEALAKAIRKGEVTLSKASADALAKALAEALTAPSKAT